MKRLALMAFTLVSAATLATFGLSGACPNREPIGPRPTRGGRDVAAIIGDGAAVEVRSFPMATPEHAKRAARRALDQAIAAWLAPSGVPADWKAPPHLVDRMVQNGAIEEITKDYGTLYLQPVSVERNESNRRQLVREYERQLAGRRLALLAGALAFVLSCLAALVAYIRADEATKGYYTTQLRLAAVTGVAAAGVVLYRVLA